MRRRLTSPVLLVVAALAVGVGVAGAALVGFSAEVQHQTSTFAGGWLSAPTALQTPTPRGYGAQLNWTPGTHGLSGQALVGTDQGTTSTCTGATYATSFATGIGAAVATYTDARGSAANGHWLCYQIQSTRGSWTTGANFAVVQIGLVLKTVAVTSVSNSGQTNNGDTIALTFNQNVTYSGAATVAVCVFGSGLGVILIGDTGCAASTDTPTIGKLTGLAIPNASKTYPTSSVNVSGPTLTVTLGGAASNPTGRTAVTGTPTFTYTATTALIQASPVAANVCLAANCMWTTSGSF